MAPPFDDRWRNVTLEGVREFLDEAAFEGITWEAKGHDLRKEHVRKAVCGFANARGGTLIVGADAVGDPARWELNGVTFPDEPPLWLDSVIRVGVTPVPIFEVKAWPVAEGKHVAAVAVEPVALPPCMTSDGAIFERVSGKTVQVIDPGVLATLSARGAASRERASTLASESAASLFSHPPFGEAKNVVFSFALAPTGLPEDFANRLFRSSSVEAINEIATAFQDGMSFGGPGGFDSTRYYLDFSVPGMHHAWSIRVLASGVVVLAYLNQRNDRGTPEAIVVMPRLATAWGVMAKVLKLLSAYEPACAVLCVEARSDQPPGWEQTPRAVAAIRRWTSLDPSEPTLASIKRELEREIGRYAWEPEPD